MLESAGHIIVAHYKDKYQRVRPHIADPRINPVVPVPNHYAYPSGHALQSYLIAYGLIDVMGDNGEHVIEFLDLADDITFNREYAGVHYASDSEAGKRIARLVFPFLRTMFHDVFEDAVHAWHGDDRSLCDTWIKQRTIASKAPNLSNSRKVEDNPGLWHLRTMQIPEALPQDRALRDIGLIDTAIDVEHPMLVDEGLSMITEDRRRNADHPIPLGEATAFGAFGTGHGTAMAGIMMGRPYSVGGSGNNILAKGVASDARLSAARISTFLNNRHDNRFEIASILLDMVWDYSLPKFGRATGSLDALVFGPPLGRPNVSDEYVTDWGTVLPALDLKKLSPAIAVELSQISSNLSFEILVNLSAQSLVALYTALPKNPIDPLIFSIYLASERTPVVIPSGNRGLSEVEYPANPMDYAVVKRTLSNPLGAIMATLTLLELLGVDLDSLGAEPASEGCPNCLNLSVVHFGDSQLLGITVGAVAKHLIERENAFPNIDPDWTTAAQVPKNVDVFKSTGVVVVGAATPDDGYLITNTVPARFTRSTYSNYGPGLALVAPSDGDDVLRDGCGPWPLVKPDVPLLPGKLIDGDTIYTQSDWHRPIASADIVGPAGWSDEAGSFVSVASQPIGFGGTSAAAASVAGLLSLFRAQLEMSGEDWGITGRQRLLDQAQSPQTSDGTDERLELGAGWAKYEDLS